MTKLLAVSIALAALVGASAKAADTSMLKTPVPSEPPFAVYNWTGFLYRRSGRRRLGPCGANGSPAVRQ
jgi:hypothetical protein